MPDIFFENDAFATGGLLQVTKNQVDDSLTSSTGRASYAEPVRLWDASTGRLTDFTTHFSFAIKAVNDSVYAPNLPSTPHKIKLLQLSFDSRQDEWDPSSDHVGININSIISVQKSNGRVALRMVQEPMPGGNSTLSYVVDLTKVLPEWIRVGFSAATGESIELHTVYSWEFESTLEASGGKGKKSFGLVVALVVTIGVLTCGSGGYWFIWWRKRVGPRKEDMALELAIDDEFEKGTGPKRFTYRELSHATKNFSEEGKLGEGGFGGVYKGLLSDSKTEVAVKRVSRGSKQGKKEYVSEVKIISRLSTEIWFNSLVGAMNTENYSSSTMCGPQRHQVQQYHVGFKFQCQARRFRSGQVVDHELGSQTTVLAGTMGYLAPECVTTGKASKESDVYSFGVVALEITCGRRPVEPRAEPSKTRLVEWVWNLYGKGQLFEAADKGCLWNSTKGKWGA
ncbi:L-type lectin-domain containing receptor kinase IX.1 [Vitis vinifera]|uniref:L-type lectin-domain containing receptor kinase IX.1 n=1 Tax=Vitis vinifera TaxID=29760 RepID=A0A438FBF4_VITVI|nr:L-type lectin-domain containing receptor kinase IX.1 [Vitis vinifera]